MAAIDIPSAATPIGTLTVLSSALKRIANETLTTVQGGHRFDPVYAGFFTDEMIDPILERCDRSINRGWDAIDK